MLSETTVKLSGEEKVDPPKPLISKPHKNAQDGRSLVGWLGVFLGWVWRGHYLG